MVNSGTEATMSALRLARGFTGRDKVVKFAGCYHGHADAFLGGGRQRRATLALPDSPGVTAAAAADTILVEYNDRRRWPRIFDAARRRDRRVIVEPVAGNMGVRAAHPGFLETALRDCAPKHGALLIFDEVITGFRVGLGRRPAALTA